ncbi:Calx-beta domain-containing protein [Lentzea atacamensis]|uniref:Calx-beta domain-containing protein n=1 Tax=Lentzea atacamensis TaxID=531938 RepID=A0A316I3C8_9PSEU|nr:Ig-like domain-containing protein [Lentzea atacamensis]PWK86897.1 Calx-beta domain-containing protein [Lentzea atacamensis]
MTQVGKCLRIAVVGAVTLGVVTVPMTAQAQVAPVVLNAGAQNSGNAQWAETQQLPGGTSASPFIATLLVQHAPGVSIVAVSADTDYDNTDSSGSATPRSVTAQTYGSAAGGLRTSRVTVPITVGEPELVCGIFIPEEQWVDVPIRMRAVDSAGNRSGAMTTTVRFVDDTNCVASEDYPRLTSAAQATTDLTPGQLNAYTFACDDVDTTGGSDDCDRANIRWRRLNNGDVSAATQHVGLDDNTPYTVSMAFPSRGHYVVEAQFGNENGNYPITHAPTGGWWRLGNAVVNDGPGSLTGSIGFAGAQPSSPPSVNEGTTVQAVATAADSGGTAQVVEWDALADGTFERLEHTVPVVSGGNLLHPNLSAAQLTQDLGTPVPGLHTVRARFTDNGALDAADASRRQLTTSGQIRVNAIPAAADLSRSTVEDHPVSITLLGSDPDGQPEPLSYEIVSPPAEGTLGPISGDSVTFTPAPDFSGTTSFTYRAADGGPATVAAHAMSNTATVTVTVIPNDPPVAVDDAFVVPAGTASAVAAPGVLANDTDADGDPLTAQLAAPAAHGAVDLAADGSFTYTPGPGFTGMDTFTYVASDGPDTSSEATVTLSVVPALVLSDAPAVGERPRGNGKVEAEFTVSLTAPSTGPVGVRAITADITAVAGSDYRPLSVDLVFQPGETRKAVRVRIESDRVPEPEETFALVLSAPTGAMIHDGTGTVLVRADGT